ncbi:aminotransferase class I/II-fold pyridoxal phosphate-dependent enzyme [Actinoplanes couchii]|nr:aminotransferase class I/II-fold pyridoxal phosphate-dependent enzyme [Actinoplanes couchii]MDR6315929.1 histidinol-phosphate aminotransferase [Actinoplanes couchii]
MTVAIRPEDIVRYPDEGSTVELLAECTGWDRSELTVFAGAESAVRAVFDLMIDPDDAVVCLHPSYHGYFREADAHQAQLRAVSYADLQLVPEAVLTAVSDDTRLVLLGNPDGLGRPLPDSLVRSVLERLSGSGGLLVVDEAYHHFGAPAMHDRIGRHPQLAVLRSFSKAWGMAGIRCGYATASADVSAMLRRVRMRNEVSGPTLALARWALTHPGTRDAYTAALAEGTRLVTAALRESGFETVPTTANFVVGRTPAGMSADEVRRRADSAGIAIAVLPGDLVRITAAPPEQAVMIADVLRSITDGRDDEQATAQPNLIMGS